MPQLSVDLDVLRDALHDRALSQVGDSLLQTKLKESAKLGELALAPSTQLAVRVLNRPQDKDEDGVFASGNAPHITFDLQSAWIKYKLSAGLDASAKVSMAGAKGSTDIVLADYRVHRATDRALTAMTSDLASPRSLLSLDDVKKLAPGEALTMEVGGSLSAKLTISWSDIIGDKLNEIFAGLPERVPVAIRLDSGLSATASVRVTDQFSVVISRTPDAHFRIAVKKAQSNDHTFGIELEAGIDVSAVQEIEDALEPAFEALVAKAADKDAMTAAIKSVKSKLHAKLESLLRWKAMTGFAYEYARIDENSAIADYILLDDSKLAEDYAHAIHGDWDAIAGALRQDVNARALIRYLNESTFTRRASFGFSLGIGKWLQVSAKDQSVFSQSTRTSLDGFTFITSKGTRRYDEKNIPQNDFEWIVDLKAQMSEFRSAPTTLDFDYGLQYAVLLERNAISEEDLARVLDFAAMWDIGVPDPALFEQALGHKGTLRVQLLFERDTLLATLGRFGEIGQWGEPLAAAMPYMSTFDERRTFEARARVYTDPWTRWLSGAPANSLGLLRRAIRSGLILLEERALPASFLWCVGDGYPQLRSRLTSFVRGAAKLRALMTTPSAPATIGNAYAALAEFWSQRLYIAASGRYLLARAREAGVTPNVTLQVEYKDTTITS
ncbi:MAG TPA: hypothetical protein VHW00_18635 [Thermoanaerobaculia bacterium]|nr:hypothetical protein [Thermoanaerobaculia bacterium]